MTNISLQDDPAPAEVQDCKKKGHPIYFWDDLFSCLRSI